MTPLRWKMIDDMQAAGLAAETQTVYLRAVAALAAHYRRAPDQLSEAEVRTYLLHLRDHRGVAHGTFQTQHGGIQFLFTQTLGRECVHRRRRLTPPLRAQHHPDAAAHARRSRLKVPQIQALAAGQLTRSRGQLWTPIGGALPH